MQTRPACTVAQLLFARPPRLDFAMLVADLEAAFRNCPEEGRHLHWDQDDLAILDVQGSRIIIGLDATLTGDHRACLTLGRRPRSGRGRTRPRPAPGYRQPDDRRAHCPHLPPPMP